MRLPIPARVLAVLVLFLGPAYGVARGEDEEDAGPTIVEQATDSVLGIEATGPGPDLVRRASGFVRDDGVVVAPLAAVRAADSIQLTYASLERETVQTRVLALDTTHGFVLLSADTPAHDARALELRAQAPKAGAILVAVSRSPAGVVKVRPMTVSKVPEVPGLGPTILFDSPFELAQDGAVLLTPDGAVAGMLRVHAVDGEVFGFGVPAPVVALMRADSIWKTPALPRDAEGGLRGLRALLAGDCGAAVAHLRAYVASDPNHAGVGTTWWQIGTCLERLGRAGEAGEAYRGAEKVWRMAGDFDGSAAATAKEIRVWRAISRVQPEMGDAWLQLGLAYEDLGDAKSALPAYTEAARTEADSVLAHRGVGWASAQLGQWPKAWQAFEKAHTLDPEDSSTLYDLAICYDKLGFDDQLAAAQKKLKALDPKLAAELIAVLGDRTAPPVQIYEAGPEFPVQRIREYWTKPYRITSMAYGDGEWGVVLTRRKAPKPQKYRSDAKISRETWNGFRKEGYALTALARRADHWVSTWTKDEAVKSQSLLVIAGFPEADLKTRLAKGLRITSIARGKGMWGVVLSYPSRYGDQIWLRGATIPSDAIQARWKQGYRITDAAYGEGRWAVILSKDSGLGEQDWVLSPSFPEKDVSQRWSEGYEISTLARGNGMWLVVLSATAGTE